MSTEEYRKRKRDWAKTESQKEYRRNYMRKWCSNNRERAAEIASEAYHRNKHKYKQRARNYHLTVTYGITQEYYNKMLVSQDNKCLICGMLDKDAPKGLHIDHDHNTGKIRGLLCSNCNGSLGWYEKHKENIVGYLNPSIVY